MRCPKCGGTLIAGEETCLICGRTAPLTAPVTFKEPRLVPSIKPIDPHIRIVTPAGARMRF